MTEPTTHGGDLGWDPDRIRLVSRALVLAVLVGAFFLIAAAGYVLIGFDRSRDTNSAFVFAVAGALVVAGLAVGVLATLTRRALRAGSPRSRRLLVATGAVILVASVPVAKSLAGVVTGVIGIVLILMSALPENDGMPEA